MQTLYQVLDEKERNRVGFVEKTSYDSGRIVFWVYDASYKMKLGYLLPNNRAYKFGWAAGKRIDAETAFPADTVSSNVRRVLDYGATVVIEQISQKQVAAELLKGRYDKPEDKQDEGGEGDADEGCGDGGEDE